MNDDVADSASSDRVLHLESGLSLCDAARLISEKLLSPVELTALFISRIQEKSSQLNGYITVLAERAMSQARQAEVEIQAGRYRGPLHGIPYGLKDNYYTAGIRTTAASKLLWNWIPTESATVFERLEAAGAILLGKHNTWEYGTGTGQVQEDLPVPPARNAWNAMHFAGGSSSGTGSSVAAGLCVFGMGSDTGGSVRIPAAANGLFGMKPTYGRISRAGILPNSFSLDVAGPLTRTACDSAMVLQAIAGYDVKDPTSSTQPVPDFSADIERGVKGLRVGFFRRFHERDVVADPAVLAALEGALDVLKRLGAEIVDIDTPFSVHQHRAVVSLIGQPESMAIHERDFCDRHRDMGSALRDKFLGSLTISALDYVKAVRWRREMMAAMDDALSGVDAAVCAGSFYRVPRHDDQDAMIAYTMGSAMCCFNVTGHPAAAVCTGFDEAGLPLGMQIVGRHWDESMVLRIAAAFQEATAWHMRRPMFADQQGE